MTNKCSASKTEEEEREKGRKVGRKGKAVMMDCGKKCEHRESIMSCSECCAGLPFSLEDCHEHEESPLLCPECCTCLPVSTKQSGKVRGRNREAEIMSEEWRRFHMNSVEKGKDSVFIVMENVH
jgi:hypothetical protein